MANQSLISNFEETRNIGMQIKSENEQFNQLLKQIKATNEETSIFWKGDAAETYRRAVVEQMQHMEKLVECLENAGDFVIKAANILEETEKNNASSIKMG